MSFYSQFGEDKLLASIFPVGHKGVCVEVGAYDGRAGSNTLHFEEKGWKCLCVEPIPKQYEKCRAIRKEVVNCCVGETNRDSEVFTIFKIGSNGENESAISSLEPDVRLIESHKHLLHTTEQILVKVKTLTTILDEANFPTTIDFISIDTENTELNVLKGFDFNKYTVSIFLIENNYNEPFCEEYLKPFGYEKKFRLGVNDIFVRRV
jgi:FkbM family methyltransferase